MPDPVVWPLQPNWQEKIVEGYGYRTAVLVADDSSEQRKGLRRHPAGSIEFSFMSAEAREAQAAMALLLANGDKLWAVPLWPYVCRLTAPTSIGALTLPCDTAGAPFQDPLGLGDFVLVWKDYLTWELLEIQGVTGVSVDLGNPATMAWPASQSLVIPIRLGRLVPEFSAIWETGVVLSGRLHFDFECVSGSASGSDTFVLVGDMLVPA